MRTADLASGQSGQSGHTLVTLTQLVHVIRPAMYTLSTLLAANKWAKLC